IEVIHNAIPLQEYDRQFDPRGKRASMGLSDSDQVIGTVGRLHPQKGHQVLLEALSFVVTRLPNVRLLIVGDGPLRASLESSVSRAGLASEVRFLGERRDVPEILAACDLFAGASNWEPFGICFLEAMAAGKPVVGSAVDGVPEVIEHGRTG